MLLSIIKQRMAIPTPLLETIVCELEQEIKTKFPSINYFYVSIQKQFPPINADVFSSEVIIEKTY
jgi:dihydroneopterin aldolase